MPSLSPGEVLRRWFEEVWNGRDPSRVPHYLAADGIIHALDEHCRDAVGPEGFLPFLNRFLGNFSNISFTVHDVVEQGPMAAGRWTVTLTHTGDGLGMPATGRSVTVSGMSLVRVENGKLVEGWDEWDRQGLARALTAPLG
jgi:predicted ester cyclase